VDTTKQYPGISLTELVDPARMDRLLGVLTGCSSDTEKQAAKSWSKEDWLRTRSVSAFHVEIAVVAGRKLGTAFIVSKVSL